MVVEELTLYDYYIIQTGYKPPESIEDETRHISLKSEKGKHCKRAIDGGVGFLSVLNSQIFDKTIVDVIGLYLLKFLAEEKQ